MLREFSGKTKECREKEAESNWEKIAPEGGPEPGIWEEKARGDAKARRMKKDSAGGKGRRRGSWEDSFSIKGKVSRSPKREKEGGRVIGDLRETETTTHTRCGAINYRSNRGRDEGTLGAEKVSSKGSCS